MVDPKCLTTKHSGDSRTRLGYKSPLRNNTLCRNQSQSKANDLALKQFNLNLMLMISELTTNFSCIIKIILVLKNFYIKIQVDLTTVLELIQQCGIMTKNYYITKKGNFVL